MSKLKDFARSHFSPGTLKKMKKFRNDVKRFILRRRIPSYVNVGYGCAIDSSVKFLQHKNENIVLGNMVRSSSEE